MTTDRLDPLAARGVTPPLARAHQAQAQVTEQWLACLAAADRRADLEAVLARPRAGDQAAAHYYLAVALAGAGEWDRALAEARRAFDRDNGHRNARGLAFKLLVRQARALQAREDWQRLDGVLAEAADLAPDDGSGDAELGRFANAMPAACLRTGRRPEAARIWERAFTEQPSDTRALHSLALMHYWWAMDEERQTSTTASAVWHSAIAYWTATVSSDQFWSGWTARRERSWGLPVAGDDVDGWRASLLEDLLDRRFQNHSIEHRGQQRMTDAQRHDGYLAAASRERRSADAWKKALSAMSAAGWRPRELDASPHLGIPAGYLFFEKLGLLQALRDLVQALAAKAPAEPCLTDLAIQFSPHDLGLIAVTIDQARYEQALSMLDRLPKAATGSVEAQYVRAQALVGRATELRAQNQIGQAVSFWGQAIGTSRGALKSQSRDSAFTPVLKALFDSTAAAATSAVQREATRLKNAEKLEPAITLLEQAHSAIGTDGVRDYLCLYYCDRGAIKIGQKKFEAARTEFQRALKLVPNHQRAKSGMSTTYNNESLPLNDPDKEVALLEKALEFDPNNSVAKSNLAVALNAKGVKILNGLSQYTSRSTVDEAVRAFRRSAKLLNAKVDDSVLNLFESIGTTGVAQIDALTGKIDDPQLKVVLKHLGMAAAVRSRLGY